MKKLLLSLAAMACISLGMNAQTAKLVGPDANGTLQVYWEGVSEITPGSCMDPYDGALAVLVRDWITNGNITLDFAPEGNNADAEICIFNKVTPNYLNVNLFAANDELEDHEGYVLWIQRGYVNLDGVPNESVRLTFNIPASADDDNNGDDNNGGDNGDDNNGDDNNGGDNGDDNNGGDNDEGDGDINSGIGSVNVENGARYFTLQGIEVMNPQNGIFIKVSGNIVSKVVIR